MSKTVRRIPSLEEIEMWWDGHEEGINDAHSLLLKQQKKRTTADRWNEHLEQTKRNIWCDGYVNGFRAVLQDAAEA